MLIDTHAHLHVKEFDSDRDAVIERARGEGVSFINVGFEPQGNEECANLSQKYGFYFTCGIHPHEADLATPENLKKIENIKRGKSGSRLVAIGETGLDYFKNRQSQEAQKKAFQAQINLAKHLDLALIVHCRDAMEDALEILDKEKAKRVVFHCFAGNSEEANECFKRGYFIGITGICTYPKAEDLRTIIQQAPVDKLLIETDCPFLAPQSFRGKRNEPVFVKEVFRQIAKIKKMPEIQLEDLLRKNTENLFQVVMA